MNRIQQVAVRHRHALRQAGDACVFVWLVGDDGDARGTFCAHALGDLQHRVAFGPLANPLPAGHGDGVVVQDFVGDVDASGNALAYRQQATMKVSAVTDVGEHVLVMAKGLLAHPRHALAAHLGEADRCAVHPD